MWDKLNVKRKNKMKNINQNKLSVRKLIVNEKLNVKKKTDEN